MGEEVDKTKYEFDESELEAIEFIPHDKSSDVYALEKNWLETGEDIEGAERFEWFDDRLYPD